ncbi:acyl-CoA thioesterase domain-containing protein [Gordonia sp. LSe1-13]|uniref:Acyl-CoA thioesterase domain-containing protein n=1 Tax=Gordonia sesuvii TaxID=3116777 RepID=A0ABU7MJX3_9ACTN|nr:acyl-CoA thioesterase domain-containing protein [Gordonia sp. LSe1-13]
MSTTTPATADEVKTAVTETNTFTSDFGLVSLQPSAERSFIRADLTDPLRSHAGTAPVGMLVTVLDFVASDPALVAAAPDWTATQDLALHMVEPITEGPIVMDSRLTRVGKKVVVVSVDVYDAHGRSDLRDIAAEIDAGPDRPDGPTLAARGLVTFARIPRSAAFGADAYTPDQWIGQVRKRAVVPIADPIHARLGIREVEPASGVLELDRTPFVANQIGTIMGGAQALLIECAAQAMRPDLLPIDMQMHFLAQVRVGPARTYGTVVRDGTDHSVVSIRMVDAGADDMTLTLATVTLARTGYRH